MNKDKIEQEVLSLANKLISIPSVSEDIPKLENALDFVVSQLDSFTVERFSSNGKPSALIYAGKARPSKFKVILNGHLDVVPAKEEMFKPIIDNGKLKGRGSYDMKTAAIVFMLIFKNLAHKLNYPIALQLVCDEEVGGKDGTRYQVEQGVDSDFVIIGEKTELDINNQSKGVYWVELESVGIAAHSAYLWEGKNALAQLTRSIENILEAFPIPKSEEWVTTANISKVETSNITYNKVPEHAKAIMDIRYIPEDIEMISHVSADEKISGLLVPGVKIKESMHEPPHLADKDNSYVEQLMKSAKKFNKNSKFLKKHGSSDARYFTEKNMPAVTMGLSGSGIHADNEVVEISSISALYNIIDDFLNNLSV